MIELAVANVMTKFVGISNFVINKVDIKIKIHINVVVIIAFVRIYTKIIIQIVT
ncbi:hypothetical protein H8356DRAFT_1332454 [Neocallimastix lanati (nom. inval.)]|nr:hypothetical protein H8356DRAFT_1332454 [Neocallimastix sp. JGI-2020a]